MAQGIENMSRESNNCVTLPASFRDPSGFIFQNEGELYRQVNLSYKDNYQMLMDSGLYAALVKQGMFTPHVEVDGPVADKRSVWRILRPEPIPLISYPYEWCFSQLKDAALLTLDIQCIALDYGMCLKDASAYNVQFHHGRPIFIDTLSFEPYVEGLPWVAYRQFCQHFLAPLAVMAKRDVRLMQLKRAQIDGLPLDLASILLLDGLRKTISRLDWKPGGTEWGDYYNDTNYSDSSFEAKRRHIESFLDDVDPTEVWDLGANIGLFSRIASNRGLPTVAFDIDPTAVETNYRQVREQSESSLLPLLLDLTNPSPGLGWNSTERDALTDRGPVDCIMALALIHHLSISNNVPFGQVASFFADLCSHSLIIEFVPKSDSQAQRLLRSRNDIFIDYDREHFEQAFSEYFTIRQAEPIEGSERILYLMNKNPA